MTEPPLNEAAAPDESGTATNIVCAGKRAQSTAPRPPNQVESAFSRDFIARPGGELPQFLRDLIAAVPSHGAGVHQWLFKVARQLHAHRPPDEIVNLLRAAVDGCGRAVPDREILAAVGNAAACAWQPSGRPAPALVSPAKWPPVDASRVAAVLRTPRPLVDLWEASPAVIEPGAWPTDAIIACLFPGDPLLCVGQSMSDFKTAPRSSFQNLSDKALIVPSAMVAIYGRRKSDGGKSMHTLENTGPRQYLVNEFDDRTQDEQATIIFHLAEFAPLAMVLSSGGKSLHAWFSCEGATVDEQRRFFRYAVAHGADPATWTRSQFVRMPEGWRADKGKRQAVFFFNPGNAMGGAHTQ